MTGSTQGIRFKINPPKSAKPKINGNENCWFLIAGEASDDMTCRLRSAERSLSFSVNRIEDAIILAFSSSVTGTTNVAVDLSLFSVNFGAPKKVNSGPSIKISGSLKGSPLFAFIVIKPLRIFFSTSINAPVVTTLLIFSLWAFPSPGIFAIY